MQTIKPPYIDSHAHLDMLTHRGLQLEEVLKDAFDNGLEGIIAIACADKNGQFEQGIAPARMHRRIWSAAGVHPHAASIYNDTVAATLRTALIDANAVALGEIGLDYHYNYSEPKAQRQAFIAQINLARELNLPVVIHTRNADDDTISILKGEGVQELGGVIHCFSSGETLAREALDMGLYLSFSGIVTFPKSTDVQDVVRWAPENRILCETDSPFLSPAPHRGKINIPGQVQFVTQKVAALRNSDLMALATTVWENTRRCFKLPVKEK
ncbi:MAG: TatD family hydrolase [Deltaproteobacteria bacterium]|nr:TatD family hydrolase [Deltaproteobacteria bacterium]